MNKIGSDWFKIKVVFAIMIGSSLVAFAQGENPLVTGKSLTPVPGAPAQNVGSLPMNMVLTPGGKFAIVSDMGFRQSLWCIDTETGRGVDHLVFDNSDKTNLSNSGLYYGLAARRDPSGSGFVVYAGTGGNNQIDQVDVSPSGKLKLGTPIICHPGDFTAGIDTDEKGRVYCVNNEYYPASSVATGAPDLGMLTKPGSLAVYKIRTQLEATGNLLALRLEGLLASRACHLPVLRLSRLRASHFVSPC